MHDQFIERIQVDFMLKPEKNGTRVHFKLNFPHHATLNSSNGLLSSRTLISFILFAHVAKLKILSMLIKFRSKFCLLIFDSGTLASCD